MRMIKVGDCREYNDERERALPTFAGEAKKPTRPTGGRVPDVIGL